MMSVHPCPAEPGTALVDVDTPALLLDLEVFERNLARLASALAPHRMRVRPHAKTHKCPEIARRQIAAGAVGVCCQKVSEAEAMAAGGIKDVFVSNEIVGAPKLVRLAELARHARVAVCVDDARNVADLAAAAARAGSRLDVFVEIDVGSRRCGVVPGAPAVALACQVAASAHLRFAGLQAYHGPAQHMRSVAERQAASAATAASVRQTRALLAARGLRCETVTGGGTGTCLFDAASGAFDEIQPGSYVFMDADYAANEATPGARFEQSLFVWTTLMSRPAATYGAVDAGAKAVSNQPAMSQIHGHAGVTYARATDEHGVLRFDDPACNLAVGDKLMLAPGHCDPTVNLHDWILGMRDGRVEAVWPIAARGATR